jgi:hypothetical protein
MATLSGVGVTVTSSAHGTGTGDVSLRVHTEATGTASTGAGATDNALQSPHTTSALANKGAAHPSNQELKSDHHDGGGAEADTPLLDDAIIDNGATTIRVTAFFAAVCNLFFFVNIAAM